MEVTKQAIAEAANYLVEVKDYAAHVSLIVNTLENWGDRHVKFVGVRAPLNALINLGLEYPEKLEQLWRIIEVKRKQAPISKRTDYQREFMAQTRARLATAMAIESLVEGRPLTRAERTKREAAAKAGWAQRKEQFLAEQGGLDWHGRNEASRVFWNVVDEELQRGLAEAKSLAENPTSRKKYTVKVPPQAPKLNRQLYDAIQAAKAKPGGRKP